ncbi:uncharacterized protein LOC131878647 [Tigriopus californicus]|uniref:uncharacterized protein LOC131878647 n=1 Tax=Tigriopus californicus TaxID=6832 RepID=UPI0027DA3BEC|nr:uncharacterized protein LOC131878647 [Tigriopus californicus]
MEEERSGYMATLDKLTFNSRPVIVTLTELAHESKQPSVIAKCIVERIRKINPERKLPSLYLMDSIVKNHGLKFKDLFEPFLVDVFAWVFEANEDVKIRTALYKLRCTWNDVFGAKALFHLDTRIKKHFDPKWPIANPAIGQELANPTKIHINPNYFKKGTIENLDEESKKLDEEVRRKQDELKRIQLKRMEMQLEQERKLMEQQMKGLKSASSTPAVKDIVKEDSTQVQKPNSEETTKRSKDPRLKSKATLPVPVSSSEVTKQDQPPVESKPNPVRKTPPPPQIRNDFKGSNAPLKANRPDEKSPKKSSSSSSSSSSSKRSGPSSSSSRSSSNKKNESSSKKVKVDRSPSRTPSPLDANEGPVKKFKIPKKSGGSSQKKRSPSPSFKEEGPFAEFNKGRRMDGTKGTKRRGSALSKNGSPKDKKPKANASTNNQDLFGDDHSLPPNDSNVGWAKFKESNPDEYRTPLRDSDRDRTPNQEPDRRFPGGRNSFRGRGGFNMPRNHGDRPPGGNGPMGAASPFFPSNQFAGDSATNNFVGEAFPNFDNFMHTVSQTDPHIVETQIIPSIIHQAREGLEQARLSQEQFSHLMRQVMSLKEAAMMAQADKRHHQAEGKENSGNRNGGVMAPWSAPNLPGGPGPFPGPPMANMGPRPPSAPGPFNGMHGPVPPMMGGPNNLLPAKSRLDLPFPSEEDLKAIEADPYKSLPIDNCPREIRFYGEMATCVMDENDVRDLSFQGDDGLRRVIVDQGLVTVSLKLDVTEYTDFNLDGMQHKIKLGAPTRELWIDGQGYQCYFDKAISVKLGPNLHEFFLEGPPPRVRIGEHPRPDLCAGYVRLIINGDLNNAVRLFLDPKPQRVDIMGKPHVLRFVEGLRTLLINGHPFRTEFGGMPIVIYVNGQKQYLRLPSLPQGVKLGQIRVIGLVPPEELEQAQHVQGFRPGGPAPPSPPSNSNGPMAGFDSEGVSSAFDKLLPLFRGFDGKTESNRDVDTMSESSYKCDQEVTTADSGAAKPGNPAPSPAVNVHNLWSQLLGAGLVSTGNGDDKKSTSTNGGIPGLDTPKAPVASNIKIKEEDAKLEKSNKNKDKPENQVHEEKVIVVKKIVFKSHHKTMKERQQGLINQLYDPAALQCKNCGLRFSPGDMISYSQHLDWHFRMNRREKDNARKAQSRKWYFERMDWIISDEIEVAEDKDLTEAELRGSANTSPEPEKIPTVPVSEDSVKREGEGSCSICKEEFDQFFKEGTDDDDDGKWHYRNAILVEDEGIFHPQCHADKANSQHNFLIDESFHEEDEEEEEEKKPSTTVAESDVPMDEPVVMAEAPEKDLPTETEPEVKLEPDQEMTDVSDKVPEEDTTVPIESEVQPESELSAVLVKEERPCSPSTEASEAVETVKPELSEAEVKVEPPKEESEGVESQTATELSEETNEKEPQPEEASQAPPATAVSPSHDTSLEDSSMIAPSMSQEPMGPKPGIRINITSQVDLERRESVVSNHSDKESAENSEFDPEAIVQEAKLNLDVLKPKLKDRKFTELPPQNRGQELSGLCLIM